MIVAEQGAYPFAVVVSRSHCTISVEEIFDRGIGDIYVVTGYGIRVSDFQVASVEYAMAEFGTSVVVVLGCDGYDPIRQLHYEAPADEGGECDPDDPLLCEHDVKIAAPMIRKSIVEIVRLSEFIRNRIGTGQAVITGAIYDERSGRVRWVDL